MIIKKYTLLILIFLFLYSTWIIAKSSLDDSYKKINQFDIKLLHSTLEKSNYKNNNKLLTQLTNKYKDNNFLIYQIILNEIKFKKYNSAEDIITFLIQQNKAVFLEYWELINIYFFHIKDYKKCLNIIDKVKNKFPHHIKKEEIKYFFYIQGVCYFNLKKYLKSEYFLKKSLKINVKKFKDFDKNAKYLILKIENKIYAYVIIFLIVIIICFIWLFLIRRIQKKRLNKIKKVSITDK